ncbi:MAG TPA: hypothetical protein PLZ98_08510 [Chitinophagaceae bacterium]|nr:hypothetical protein [Chitinophagaceae bacterium]
MTQENLKHLFGAYPNQAEFFETADGTTFLSKQTAEAYAEERLEDKHIKTLTRDDIEEDVKTPKETAKGKAKAEIETSAEATHTVTQDDLDNNPDLADAGIVEGDEIGIGKALANELPEAAPKKNSNKKPSSKK